MTSALRIIDIVVVVCLGSAAPHLGPMMGLEPHHFSLICGASMTPVMIWIDRKEARHNAQLRR